MRNRFLTNRRRARFQADLPEGATDLLLSVAKNQENVVGLRDIGWAPIELAPDQHEVVLLAGEGVSTLDAADRLGIPGETFKSRVTRGRTRMRLLTDEQGTHCSQIARRPFAPALSSPDPNAIGQAC